MNNYNSFEIIRSTLRTTFQFYRSTLQADELKCYDKMVLGIINYNNTIQIDGINANKIEKIFNYIKMDNPLLFYVKELSIKYEQGFKRTVIIPKYRFDKKTANDNIIAVLSRVKKILSSISSSSDFNTEKEIHDYFCSNIHYDKNFAESSYECVGPILFQKGVCEGISKASKLLCDFLELNCIVIHGISTNTNVSFGTNAHTWNKICINDYYYNLDITFDLTISSNGLIRYDYFNLNDCDVLKDHKFNNCQIPACVKDGCYYFVKNQMFTTTKEIRQYLLTQISNNNKTIVFKVLNNNSNIITERKIIHCINSALESLKKYGQHYQYSFNETQGVMQIELM